MILILKHIEIEGPGSLGDFLNENFDKVKTLELQNGDKLPEYLSDLQAIVILGGPMNVYEEDRYPFLKDEEIFLKSAIANDIPTLGICLGAQLIAKALGAKVEKADLREIGWHKVSLTFAGEKDKVFQNSQKEFDVFQWHEDTFKVPKGAELLATSTECANQAFRYKNLYGFQFHIEVREKEIASWVKEYNGLVNQEYLDYYKKNFANISKNSLDIYKNFKEIINQNKIKNHPDSKLSRHPEHYDEG